MSSDPERTPRDWKILRPEAADTLRGICEDFLITLVLLAILEFFHVVTPYMHASAEFRATFNTSHEWWTIGFSWLMVGKAALRFVRGH